jgi:RNA polymerase sigma-70 factor, ECF subfamily
MGSDPALQAQVTALLTAVPHGDPGAVERLVPLIYDELRAMAHRELAAERRADTLQTTDLVHEAYLRLAGNANVVGRGRAYFFAAVSRAMRQILVERARSRSAVKRGGGAEVVTLGEKDAAVDTYAVELLELDEALHHLAGRSPRQAAVVEYRFFAGMTVKETADALGISTRTVESDWALARAWLFRSLGKTDAAGTEDPGP